MPELRRFTPWVIPDEPELDTLIARIETFRARFDSGESSIYGIFDPEETRVIGQIGLYARVGPGALELGYFIRSDETGRGYATEAARALIDAGFVDSDVERIEIRCEPENEASIAIARRLGFRMRETVLASGGTSLTIWELSRSRP
jgi:RimJ/RimL family protein N-acetyltransferase